MKEFCYRLTVENVPPDDGGGYVAYYPTLGKYAMNGVGDSIGEALESLRESKEAVLEFMKEQDIPLPSPTGADFEALTTCPNEAAINNYALAA